MAKKKVKHINPDVQRLIERREVRVAGLLSAMARQIHDRTGIRPDENAYEAVSRFVRLGEVELKGVLGQVDQACHSSADHVDAESMRKKDRVLRTILVKEIVGTTL